MNYSNNACSLDPRGFTLVEIMIAVSISAVVMVMVATTFITTLRAQKEVASLTESTEAGSRILNLIERDLRGLWIHNIKDNKVLRGRNMDLSSDSADRIDFLTSTDSVSTIASTDQMPVHSTICEVGYWLKPHPRYASLMQLYRREDPMVDEDLERGGTFQKVHDRLRNFNITYYETVGRNAEEIHDWDSSERDTLPRVIKIEFTIERKLASSNEVTHAEVADIEDNNKKYVRYIVLDKDYPKILQPELALIPVLPMPPGAAGEGPGGAGAGEGKGPAGTGAGPSGRGQTETTYGRGEGDMNRGEGRGNRGSGLGDRQAPTPRGNNPFGNQPIPKGLIPGNGGTGQKSGVNLGDLFKQFGGR